jgi:rSAM/selenodomain-associated transferase 2
VVGRARDPEDARQADEVDPRWSPCADGGGSRGGGEEQRAEQEKGDESRGDRASDRSGAAVSRAVRARGTEGPPRISIVVPALDEEGEISRALATTRAPEVADVLVVDGGSRDRTVAVAAALADRVVAADRGRASQMNAGAAATSGEVLLFLHADTWLPAGFGRAICEAIDAGAVAGRFDVELRGRHAGLPLVAAMMNWRSRLTRMATGDQAIFVRRDVFRAIGGYAAIPLMEDVDLSRRLRRAGPYAALRLKVSTSGRRWEDGGLVRTIVLMWRLRFAFWRGVPAERLAALYARAGS